MACCDECGKRKKIFIALMVAGVVLVIILLRR